MAKEGKRWDLGGPRTRGVNDLDASRGERFPEGPGEEKPFKWWLIPKSMTKVGPEGSQWSASDTGKNGSLYPPEFTISYQ